MFTACSWRGRVVLVDGVQHQQAIKLPFMQMLCILFLGCRLLLTAGLKLTPAEDEFGAALQGRDESSVATVLRRVSLPFALLVPSLWLLDAI